MFRKSTTKNKSFNVIAKIKDILVKYLHLMMLKIIPQFINLYVKFIFIFANVEFRISKEIYNLLRIKTPIILLFWHGRLLLMPHFVKECFKINGIAIVSSHRDGEYIARFLGTYGHSSIRGSSNNRGFTALKDAIYALKNNNLLAITPDGPTGPRYKINSNITNIAKTYNIPILCACYSAKYVKIFNTWDRFMLPYIWNQRIIIEVSSPIYISRLIEQQYYNINEVLSNILNDQMHQLDKEINEI